LPTPDTALVLAPQIASLQLRLAEARARTRAALAEVGRGAQAEVTRRIGWRAVFRANPMVCVGLALALGFVVGHRR
jgi:primosomal protein N'